MWPLLRCGGIQGAGFLRSNESLLRGHNRWLINLLRGCCSISLRRLLCCVRSLLILAAKEKGPGRRGVVIRSIKERIRAGCSVHGLDVVEDLVCLRFLLILKTWTLGLSYTLVLRLLQSFYLWLNAPHELLGAPLIHVT